MTTIYAAIDGTIIWSSGDKLHKQGRVPLHEPLTVLREYAQNWFIIERPTNISLDPNPSYPDYWVYSTEILETLPVTPDPDPEDPQPDPDPEQVSDEEFAQALVTMLKWMRQPVS